MGRNKLGCFPEVVVRSHFEEQGYAVLLSEPRYPGGRGFVLFHYRGLRRDGDPAFQRMETHFPSTDLDALAELAYREKREQGLSGSGGDPDLFVYREDGSEQFFVEVKDEDQLHVNQRICFPLIEKHLGCEVKVARIEPDGAPGGGPSGR